MDAATLNKLIRDARIRQDSILTAKGADYTRHEEDRLSNFRRSARAVGLTPQIVWAVFFMKHIDAIMAYIKTGHAESEAIEGRIDDAINYLFLLLALIEEGELS